jgi:hypothetical protein
VATSLPPVLKRLLLECRRIASPHSAVAILTIGGFAKCGQGLVHQLLLIWRTVDYFHVGGQTGCGEDLLPTSISIDTPISIS